MKPKRLIIFFVLFALSSIAWAGSGALYIKKGSGPYESTTLKLIQTPPGWQVVNDTLPMFFNSMSPQITHPTGSTTRLKWNLHVNTWGGTGTEMYLNTDYNSCYKKDAKTLKCVDKACPWVYVDTGMGFEKQVEIIKNLVGKEQEAELAEPLTGVFVENNVLRIQVHEEKDEISYIDYLAIEIEGRQITPSSADADISLVEHRDGRYLVMKKGDVIEFKFSDPAITPESAKQLKIVSKGYYDRL